MNRYESEQLDAIEKWKSEEPSVLAQTFGKVSKPISWLVQKMIPQGAIESVLKGLNALASKFADKDDIIRDAGVGRIPDLRNRHIKSLEDCDRLANNVTTGRLELQRLKVVSLVQLESQE